MACGLDNHMEIYRWREMAETNWKTERGKKRESPALSSLKKERERRVLNNQLNK